MNLIWSTQNYNDYFDPAVYQAAIRVLIEHNKLHV